MIKIICALCVAIASVFAFVPNISSTSASSFNGQPGESTTLSYLYRVKTYNRGANEEYFDTNSYANYQTRNIFQYLDYNTLNADMGASYSSRNDNTGYTVVYAPDLVLNSAGVRPTQYEFSVSSNTTTTAYYYSQFFFNSGNSYSGSVVVQFPNFAWYSGGTNDNVVLTTATYSFTVYYTPRSDYQTRQLTPNVYVRDNYTYCTFDIPDNTALNDFVVFYTKVYSSSNIGTGNFFTYNFCNMTLQNDSDVQYALGYNDGRADANNTVSTGSASYNAGYSAGIDNANNTVRIGSASYNAGYSNGINDADSYSFTSLVSSVIDAPVKAFRGLLNFEILGVNVSAFVLGLFSVGLLIAVFKFLIR